ncbi:hypothetical protein QBC46DRAFT_370539 [Diplogelasinospora grovesii]|uniref:J domain-containing protein n=1 Tax=Diplogelasinospora grovesii TaxID=303347 RepID=A0AAN6SAM4_9PEZI|nr:hypothetical protein QBC46DRAFT_370539 [Diplogelasinospora grovesii]
MSGVISLLGWSFLPSLVTGYAQSIYYAIITRAGDRKPQPGSPRFVSDRRKIHILVVTLYLLYTVYEADYDLRRAGTFYEDLTLPFTATEKDIKSRFRRLAAIHHPDKVQSGSVNAEDINAKFVHLKTAADTLTNSAKRFAYERFGPGILEWQRCSSTRDYVFRGAQVSVAPYYAVAAALMYCLGLLGYLDWGRYERWLALAGLFLFEIHAITRPYHPPIFDSIINPVLGGLPDGWARPPYLPFQAIALARKLCLTLYIAFSQIGPLLSTGGGQEGVQKKKKGSEEQLLRQGLERLEMAARSVDSDAERLLGLEMAPFVGGEGEEQQMQNTVMNKVKEWLVNNTIRSDPMVRDAVGTALRKRRVDAPAGARGTK